MNGIPYAPWPPKSGCNNVRPPVWLIVRTNVAESDRTGSFETSWFHALFAGNTRQPPTIGGDGVAWGCTLADAGGNAAAAANTAAGATSRKTRRAAMRFHRPYARPTLNLDRS